MRNLDTLSVLFTKIAHPFGPAVLDPSHEVSREALRGITQEASYIKERRAEAIAYLRSFNPSKYVLDGAEVDLHAPRILGRQHEH